MDHRPFAKSFFITTPSEDIRTKVSRVGPGPYYYIYPPNSEVDYFIGKGMNTFRLPFRWERLQRSLNGNLNADELGRMNAFVDYVTGQGAHVIIDPHNFAQYYGNAIGSSNVSVGNFADFWGKVAAEFNDNPNVIFGLMNEPVNANQQTAFRLRHG